MKTMKKGLKISLITAAVLLFGGLSTICQHDFYSYRLDDGSEFNYPNFPNFLMFTAMSSVGFFWLGSVRRAKQSRAYTLISTKVEQSANPRENIDDLEKVGTENVLYGEGGISEDKENIEHENKVTKNSSISNLSIAENENNIEADVEEGSRNNLHVSEEVVDKVQKTDKKKCKRLSSKWLQNPYVALIFSAIFDLLASTLGSVALSPTCNVPSSVYQLLQAALVPFTTLLSICFLKAKFKLHHWMGVLVVIIGLVFVALSSYFVTKYFTNEEEETSNAGMLVLGIFLILAAQLIYALQFIIEEFTMKNCKTLPSQVVCIEGAYGLFLTLVLVWPILYGTKIENDYEAFEFIGKKPAMIVQIVLFVLVIMFYNLMGQMLTQTASAAHRTIVEAMRAAVVWIMSLLEYAMWPTDDAQWGEKFYSWASVIQLIGFIILTIGSLTYYEVIKWEKCFRKCCPKRYAKIDAKRSNQLADGKN